MSGHTSEFVKSEDALKQLKRDVEGINFDDVDAVVFVSCEGGEVSMNVLGDLSIVAQVLRAALKQIDEAVDKPLN